MVRSQNLAKWFHRRHSTICRPWTKICTGVVGGSDLVKQKEQLGDSPALFDYAFAENGLMAFKDGQKIGETSLVQHLGEEKLKKLIGS